MARVALALVTVASACILGAAATDVTTPFEDEGQGACSSASCHALLQRTTKPRRAAVFAESGSAHRAEEMDSTMSQSMQQDQHAISRAIMQMGVGMNRAERWQMGVGNNVELIEQSSSGDKKKEDLSFIGHSHKKKGRDREGELSEGEARRAGGASSATFNVRAAMFNNMLDILAELNLGPGTTVPLNEEGYAEVAELRDPQQMEFFVRRIVSQLGLRIVDQGGLHGFVPYFDGEELVQSYPDLENEIKKEATKTEDIWVTDQVSGASAPLSQDGYEHVATLANNREMAEFVRRVASDLGLSVKNEGPMNGLAQWHSGERATQTFSDLQGELINASKNNSNGSWIAKSKPCPGTGHPSNDELEKIQSNTSWAGSNKTVSLHPKKKQATRERQTLERMKKGTVYVDENASAAEEVNQTHKKKVEKESELVGESANSTSKENAKPQAETHKQRDSAVDEAVANENADAAEKVEEHAKESTTEDESHMQLLTPSPVSEHVQKSQAKKSKTIHPAKPPASKEELAVEKSHKSESKKSKTKPEAAATTLEQEEKHIAKAVRKSPSKAAKSKSQLAQKTAAKEEHGEALVENMKASESKLSKVKTRAVTKTMKKENKEMLQKLKEEQGEESKNEPEPVSDTVGIDAEESAEATEESKNEPEAVADTVENDAEESTEATEESKNEPEATAETVESDAEESAEATEESKNEPEAVADTVDSDPKERAEATEESSNEPEAVADTVENDAEESTEATEESKNEPEAVADTVESDAEGSAEATEESKNEPAAVADTVESDPEESAEASEESKNEPEAVADTVDSDPEESAEATEESKNEPEAAAETVDRDPEESAEATEDSKNEPEAAAETVDSDPEESAEATEESENEPEATARIFKSDVEAIAEVIEAKKASSPIVSEMAKSGKVKAVHVAKAKKSGPGDASKKKKVKAATQVESSKQAHKKVKGSSQITSE